MCLWCQQGKPINLFSLYVLFSHFRPRDATRGNSFFQMSSYARANVRITNGNERKIPMRASRGLKWENKMHQLKRSIASLLKLKHTISCCNLLLLLLLLSLLQSDLKLLKSTKLTYAKVKSFYKWLDEQQYNNRNNNDGSFYKKHSVPDEVLKKEKEKKRTGFIGQIVLSRFWTNNANI